MISPGVRILAAKRVSIGDACMFGHGAYITDSDWHGIYDRTEVVGSPKEVVLEKNVWIGDSAIVCKGVTIGENSIIGAGSVVTKDVPKNSVYAGNPAKLVKELDEGEFVSRESFFSDPKKLADDFDMLDRYTLAKNSTFSWIKSLIFRDKSHKEVYALDCIYVYRDVLIFKKSKKLLFDIKFSSVTIQPRDAEGK